MGPRITRPVDEEFLSRVKSHLATERARESLRRRKYWPETVFAEMKGPRGLNRATLRGTIRVHIQALLALAVHNIRQLVRVMGERKRWLPRSRLYWLKYLAPSGLTHLGSWCSSWVWQQAL